MTTQSQTQASQAAPPRVFEATPGNNVVSTEPLDGAMGPLLNLVSDREQLKRSWSILANVRYDFYVEYTHKGLYKHGKHTKYICNVLQRVESGELKRVIITTPPRHSKSMTVTETFPSYFIGKRPERRVIQVSYGDTLARKFGRANKSKIVEYGADIFDIRVSQDTSAADNWGIQGHRGGMISTGIGGAITGEGADLLLIDDPVKNREEANSEAYRNKVWDEWQNTLRTRLHPGAAVVIIITRWHEDDLVGRLLNPEYGEVEDWLIVNLPAIAEEDDLLGREVGQPLWPEHGFDLKWAEATEKAVGAATWASLYQQRPAAAEGSMIKRDWWRRYNVPYDRQSNTVGIIDEMGYHREFWIDEIIQSWDMSFKNSMGTDMVVGQIWGRSGEDKFLFDQIRGRMDFPQTIAAVLKINQKWPEARLKLVEDKANGPAVISTLSSKVGGMVAVNPRDSKIARVSNVSPDIEGGNVYIPVASIAPWIDAYVEELSSFPFGAKDDQVDATSQALSRLMKSRSKKAKPVKDNTTGDQKRIRDHIDKIAKRKKKGYKNSRSYINR